MSINTIIAIVVVAVLVLGGGYYVMSGGYSMSAEQARVGDMNGDGQPDTDVSDTGANPKMAPEAAAFTGSFFDLAARGGHYTCDVTSTGTNNGTTGTVYVSGTDLRGDFNTVASGKTIESHMLKLGADIFVWSSAMPQGIMMKATVASQGSAATQGSGVSGTQSYGWNCAATGTDASMFVKPSNVQFMDISAMMGGTKAPVMPSSAGTPTY